MIDVRMERFPVLMDLEAWKCCAMRILVCRNVKSFICTSMEYMEGERGGH